MSGFEILFCILISIKLLCAFYFSRYFGYQIFYKKLNIEPSGFLTTKIVSFAFIFWLLISVSISTLELLDDSYRVGASILAFVLVFCLLCLIAIIPVTLYKQYEVPLYKSILLELILWLVNCFAVVVFMLVGGIYVIIFGLS